MVLSSESDSDSDIEILTVRQWWDHGESLRNNKQTGPLNEPKNKSDAPFHVADPDEGFFLL